MTTTAKLMCNYTTPSLCSTSPSPSPSSLFSPRVAVGSRRHLPLLPRHQRTTTTTTTTTSQSGFGSSSKPSSTSSNKKAQRLTRFLDGTDATTITTTPDGWIELPDIDPIQTFVSKPIKPIILATGKAICLYKVGDSLFCSDANSTAYQFPLADANILGLKTGPAVECTLDGTVYDLASGKVLSWCPKNNLVRSVLGALKDKSEPIDLTVYPVRVVDNKKVLVKLTTDTSTLTSA